MAKAHGQMPSAKNAPTASAGPRYEPVGRWAVASNDATKAVGGKDKKKAGLASPSRSSGAPHSGQAKGNTQGRKQWQHSGDSRKAVSPFLLSVVISRKTTCPCEQVTRKCGFTTKLTPAFFSSTLRMLSYCSKT